MKNREICVMRKLMTPRCEDPADVFFMASSPGDLFHPTTSLFLKSRVGFVMNCRKAKNTFVHDLKNIFFEFSIKYVLLALSFLLHANLYVVSKN